MKDKDFSTPPRDIDELRDNSLPSFNGQCAICTGEQCFVLKEKGDTSKVKALDYCFNNLTYK